MKAIVIKIIDSALSYLGTPYKWGGTDRQGLDCSGLMLIAFKGGGISIPRVSEDQAKIGPQIDPEELNLGDMVFFTDVPGNKKITHVGLVSSLSAESKTVTFIHASSSKGVMESDLNSDYWQSVFLLAIRPSAFLNN
ncbi:MAG: C40 family peptidase [Microscillaceae bacterium]|nr:C40 family peptidase [Microscillaceae bacterium]